MKRRPLGRLLLSVILGLVSLTLFQLTLYQPLARHLAAQSTGPSADRFDCNTTSAAHPPCDSPVTGLQAPRSPRRQDDVRGGPAVSAPAASHPSFVHTPASTTLEYPVFLPLVRGHGSMTEARALWVTRWNYATITDVRTLIGNAADAGFNMILFQVRGAADAFYTPGLEPWGARLSGGTLGEDPGWDPLGTATEAAHDRGLELHAYLNVYPAWLGQTAPPKDTVPRHLFWTLSERYSWDDWRVVDSEGVTMTPGSAISQSRKLSSGTLRNIATMNSEVSTARITQKQSSPSATMTWRRAMTSRRYFVNLKTGGHMILDARMGSEKDKRFLDIACQHGFKEVTRERYRRLQSQGKIGEGAMGVNND